MARKRKVRSTPTAQTTPQAEEVMVATQSVEEQYNQFVQEQQIEEEIEVEAAEEQVELQQDDDDDDDEEPVESQQIGEEEDPNEEDEEEEEEEDEEDKAESEKNEIEGEANGGEGKSEVKSEEEEAEDEQEPVEKLIEPFSKEQLAVLVKEAVEKFPEFIESVQKLADADPAHRKIFVHGLGWDTNAETLTMEFSKYGEVEDCKAVTDKVSGKSKGYGFILFKHRSGAQKALKEPQKKIGNRVTSCQLASAGPVPAPPPAAPPVSEYTQRKIFVSNVSADIEPAKLVEFFSKFGEIEEGPLGLDKQTGKPKGFALFVYKTVESAKKALEEPHKTFEGHTLHCQRAIDGPKPNKPPYHQQQQQQQHQHQGYHHHAAKKSRYSSGAGGGGHLMAPSGPTVGYNPAVAPQGALTPALGQALTALLATQGAGLGNLLGGLGGPVNQGMPPVMNNAGYGNQGGGYGGQHGMQGGYQNPQMGPGSSRPQQGGGSYMGHGR